VLPYAASQQRKKKPNPDLVRLGRAFCSANSVRQCCGRYRHTVTWWLLGVGVALIFGSVGFNGWILRTLDAGLRVPHLGRSSRTRRW
jgi:hypothetical protein